MDNRYVFDLDNTLIMTDRLNNEAYNYALAQVDLLPITANTRMTRKVVFEYYPNLTKFQEEQIIALKQGYFMDNIHCTQPNLSFIHLLQSKKAAHCVLWTSANSDRAKRLLTYYGLQNNFISIIYSNKQKVSEDLEKICADLGCTSEQLFFFEDDENITKELRLLGQKVFVPNLI